MQHLRSWVLLNAIFITGTAGSGKSLLTSRLQQWYTDNGNFAATLNLDPGSTVLPYNPDIDIRDYVDIEAIVQNFGLGPNGSLVVASDMIATRLDEIQEEVNQVNADYLLIDTPGQLELFAYRTAGPYIAESLRADNKATLFTFDGLIASSPTNYVSISTLAASVKLRLNLTQINVLTKRDLVVDRLKDIISWAESHTALEAALNLEKNHELSVLSVELARSMSKAGFGQSFVAVSSLTMNGILTLASALSRTLNQGEDS